MEVDDTTIIVIGNVIDGLEFFRPFTNDESAIDYAHKNLSDELWAIAGLHKVDNGD